MTEKRDPKKDPKIGDVLRFSNSLRTVTNVQPGSFSTHEDDMGIYVSWELASGKKDWSVLGGWKKWAHKAEVVHAAS